LTRLSRHTKRVSQLYSTSAKLIEGEPLEVVSYKVDMRGKHLAWLLEWIDRQRTYYLMGKMIVGKELKEVTDINLYWPADFDGKVLHLHYARTEELDPYLYMVTKYWLVALIRCIAIALLATFSLTACTTLKGYPGPELSAEQLAIVSRPFFQRGSLSVDDQDLNIWHTKIAVLPGEHKVELYFSELLEERTIGPEHCTTSTSTYKKDNKEQCKTDYRCEYPVEVTQRAVWCIAEFVTEPKREYRVEYSDFKIVIHELNDNRIVTNQDCETGLPRTQVETRSRAYDRDGCNYSTQPFCL
jgi:hypothetical protein